MDRSLSAFSPVAISAGFYGPRPLGIGTAHEGGYCTVNGGQDDQGRMMMCLDNEWIYGP